MARSSITRTDSTVGVSRLPSRPRSPSSSPATRPGVKLSARSTTPAAAERRSAPVSSSAEYSMPNRSSSRITPISGAGLDEPGGGHQGKQPAPAERQPGEQVQRDRRQAQPARDPAEDAEPQDDPAQLQQQLRTMHGAQPPSSRASIAIPPGVPTTTAVSPASSGVSGPGAGIAWSPRRTATIEVPVRLRAWVSPSGRPA